MARRIRTSWGIGVVAAVLIAGLIPSTILAQGAKGKSTQTDGKPETIGQLRLSDAEWRKKLSPEAYHVLREKGTERAYTGKYWNNHEKGTYVCAGCGLELFDSSTKFESGTGWPSFYEAISKARVKLVVDKSLGMIRTEVLCARCDGHLGHVFDDGPKPTGLRFCMNSVSLGFVPAKGKSSESSGG